MLVLWLIGRFVINLMEAKRTKKNCFKTILCNDPGKSIHHEHRNWSVKKMAILEVKLLQTEKDWRWTKGSTYSRVTTLNTQPGVQQTNWNQLFLLEWSSHSLNLNQF